MFKKEHCFGDKLDLQYEPVSKLTYSIRFVTNLNVIQFKQLETGFTLSRFSLLCFCEYTIISHSDLQVENASDIDWKDANTIAFHCTASTKLRTFHYKFLHRRNDVKQFLIQKGLKSTALTDLHLTGL